MKTVQIKDLGRIITGDTPPRSKPELYGNHTPFIKATDISEDSKFTYNPEECYSEIAFEKYRKKLIPKGATCVNTIGSIGRKMTMAHRDCFVNQAINAVIPNEHYDNDYVYYLLRYNLPKVKQLDSGTASGRENVSKSAFSNIEISVEEDIDKQRRIAGILSKYDELIENSRKQIALLEEAAQRLYREWFVDFRFPGSTSHDSLPQGWKKGALREIIKLQSGYPFKSSTFNETGKYKVITIKNVQDNYFDGVNLSHINDIPQNMPNHCALNDGDMLLSLTGNIGRFCVVVGDNYVLNQRVAKIETRYNSFAHSMLLNEKFTQHIQNLANGAAQQNLSPIRLMDEIITIPSSDLLDDFERICKPIYQKQHCLSAEIIHIKEARDKLLPKLMSGELKV